MGTNQSVFVLILRWISAAIISPITVIVCFPLLEWIFGFIVKLFSFIIFWGTKIEIPLVYDLENMMQNIKSFILISCFSAVISLAIGGLIGGLIAPRNPIGKHYLFSLIGTVLCGGSIYFFWSSEHLLLSIIWAIAMSVGFIFYVGVAEDAEL